MHNCLLTSDNQQKTKVVREFIGVRYIVWMKGYLKGHELLQDSYITKMSTSASMSTHGRCNPRAA